MRTVAVRAAILVGLWAGGWLAPAQAQIDRVVPNQGATILGRLVEQTRDRAVIESNSGRQTVPLENIKMLVFDGEPQTLAAGRRQAHEGEFAAALEQLQRIDFSTISRDAVRSEAMFYTAWCESELALSGRADAASAIRKMRAYVDADRNGIHFYQAARVLGDLAMAQRRYDEAIRFYGALVTAPSPELRAQAGYQIAWANLRQGKATEAEAGFAAIIASSTAAGGNRWQTLAKAGQAVARGALGNTDAALNQIQDLLATLPADDPGLSAAVYNAQGSLLEAAGDAEGAVLAYLHTHLLFSGQSSADAEALSRLVELWPKVGRADRANEARQQLQQRYPGWK